MCKFSIREVFKWARSYVITPTDRPRSVRNRCVIKVLVVFFVLSRFCFDFYVSVGAFVKGLSKISSFFPLNNQYITSVQIERDGAARYQQLTVGF